MPRSLVLGNGSMLATFDEFLQLRDFYYPHVGEEDHTTYGKFHRVGFMVEGKGFSWTNDGSWVMTPGYAEDTLVTESSMRCDRLALEIFSEDFVDPTHNILLRTFRMRSTDGTERRVQCFFHHDFYLYGEKQKDTAFYEPHTKSIIHYREKRYFLVGGTTSDPITCVRGEPLSNFHPFYSKQDEHVDHCGIVSFSIGKANYRGLEGTWRDAEDGKLERYPIEQGSVDSTAEIDCLVRPDRDTTVYMWVCAGKTVDEVHDLQTFILNDTPEQVKRSARNYWRSWAHSHNEPDASLPREIQQQYWRSLLTIRTQIDNNGGIVAANDSDIMQFNRDTYTYVWPRDGAFVSMALNAAGQSEVVQKFFEFCSKVQTREGYLLHKYNPDGSVGSSWHPWFADNQSVLPIQCDETALPILALWEHFRTCQDFEFLHRMFQKFVRKAANFLVEYREPETGLPLPSYDLWEEQRGIFSFTASATCAGLRAAGSLALALGHMRHAQRYNEAADKMHEAILFHLYDEETGHFLKKIKRENGKTIEKDQTPDASIANVWAFGVLPPDDPRIVSTMQWLEKELTVHTDIGGIARYRNDYYQAGVPPSAEVPGNPWIITSLWLAQWQMVTAKTEEDLQKPLSWLLWARKRATKAGMFAEQFHPLTGVPLSVSPLTWSHATFVESVLAYGINLARIKKLKIDN